MAGKILRPDTNMAKTTIDQFPLNSIEYLNRLPQSAEAQQLQHVNPYFALDIHESLIRSEVDSLVGTANSHQTFALFAAPKMMDCPHTFGQKMIERVDAMKVLEFLEVFTANDYDEQEAQMLLQECFQLIHDTEEMYAWAIAQLTRLQKG